MKVLRSLFGLLLLCIVVPSAYLLVKMFDKPH